MPARISLNRPTRPEKKPRDGMSASHLAMVRKLPCCVCGIVGVTTAHHLLRTGEHGMAQKSSDRWAVPLCDERYFGIDGCHKRLHDDGNEERFLMQHGIDGRALAQALWRFTGDLDRMEAAVWKARHRG